MPLKPHDSIDIYVNQKDREAMVLAVMDGKALCEYEMPAGRTFLTFLELDAYGEPILKSEDYPGDVRYHIKNDYKRTTVSYAACKPKWLRAIISAGTEWYGGYTSGDSRFQLDLCRIQVARLRELRDLLTP